MATASSAAQTAAPVKKTRSYTRKNTANASATTPTHETHGAVAPSPVNMSEMFGIKSQYTAKSIENYRKELTAYSTIDLHAHAHHVGVIPLDPREKLVAVLERKFLETQSKSLPIKFFPPKVSKEGEEFIRRFMAGTA